MLLSRVERALVSGEEWQVCSRYYCTTTTRVNTGYPHGWVSAWLGIERNGWCCVGVLVESGWPRWRGEGLGCVAVCGWNKQTAEGCVLLGWQ